MILQRILQLILQLIYSGTSHSRYLTLADNLTLVDTFHWHLKFCLTFIIMKIKLTDTQLQIVVRPVPSVILTAIFHHSRQFYYDQLW